MDNPLLINIKPDIIIDSRLPSCCAGPDVQFISDIRYCKEETVIEFIAVDKNKIQEIQYWLNKIGMADGFLGVIEESGFYKIYVKKIKNL